MPQALNLTVKDAANADKTFTLLAPAPGYGVPAEWALKEGATPVAYPRFTLAAANLPPQRLRKCKIRLRVPATYNDVSTGLPVVSSYMEFNATIDVPDNFPDAQRDNATAYFKNLVAHAIVNSCYRDGLPAT